MLIIYCKLSILIPAYNEINTLQEIIGKVETVGLGAIEKEIIVIDDYSNKQHQN